MEDGGGGRSRRYEFRDETTASSAGLTLGGILSIKQTPPYRIQDRTLLDLIRDDQTYGRESKNAWKMFREKLRLRLLRSACTTAVPTLASHVHIAAAGNRTDTTRLISPPVDIASSVPDTQTENVETELPVEEQTLTEEGGGGGGDGGEPAAVRMSLMSLLEVEGSAYLAGEDDDDDEEKAEEEAAAIEVSGGGGGGGGGGYKYNYCCVCMVRHKGAAFIPCGHTFCRLCSRELFVKRASCPLCNNFIVEILDIF
ncbi:hypothetical protein SSX86_011264 [Deinandra increscens subsp. villosa]|uniref:RING-type domain-containing protein n=1 Tax=Deinandra increscens subsp. villosa TaxID=3103831 RepID=A0AAP0H1Q1_9ASTR